MPLLKGCIFEKGFRKRYKPPQRDSIYGAETSISSESDDSLLPNVTTESEKQRKIEAAELFIKQFEDKNKQSVRNDLPTSTPCPTIAVNNQSVRNDLPTDTPCLTTSANGQLVTNDLLINTPYKTISVNRQSVTNDLPTSTPYLVAMPYNLFKSTFSPIENQSESTILTMRSAENISESVNDQSADLAHRKCISTKYFYSTNNKSPSNILSNYDFNHSAIKAASELLNTSVHNKTKLVDYSLSPNLEDTADSDIILKNNNLVATKCLFLRGNNYNDSSGYNAENEKEDSGPGVVSGRKRSVAATKLLLQRTSKRQRSIFVTPPKRKKSRIEGRKIFKNEEENLKNNESIVSSHDTKNVTIRKSRSSLRKSSLPMPTILENDCAYKNSASIDHDPIDVINKSTKNDISLEYGSTALNKMVPIETELTDEQNELLTEEDSLNMASINASIEENDDESSIEEIKNYKAISKVSSATSKTKEASAAKIKIETDCLVEITNLNNKQSQKELSANNYKAASKGHAKISNNAASTKTPIKEETSNKKLNAATKVYAERVKYTTSTKRLIEAEETDSSIAEAVINTKESEIVIPIKKFKAASNVHAEKFKNSSFEGNKIENDSLLEAFVIIERLGNVAPEKKFKAASKVYAQKLKNLTLTNTLNKENEAENDLSAEASVNTKKFDKITSENKTKIASKVHAEKSKKSDTTKTRIEEDEAENDLSIEEASVNIKTTNNKTKPSSKGHAEKSKNSVSIKTPIEEDETENDSSIEEDFVNTKTSNNKTNAVSIVYAEKSKNAASTKTPIEEEATENDSSIEEASVNTKTSNSKNKATSKVDAEKSKNAASTKTPVEEDEAENDSSIEVSVNTKTSKNKTKAAAKGHVENSKNIASTKTSIKEDKAENHSSTEDALVNIKTLNNKTKPASKVHAVKSKNAASTKTPIEEDEAENDSLFEEASVNTKNSNNKTKAASKVKAEKSKNAASTQTPIEEDEAENDSSFDEVFINTKQSEKATSKNSNSKAASKVNKERSKRTASTQRQTIKEDEAKNESIQEALENAKSSEKATSNKKSKSASNVHAEKSENLPSTKTLIEEAFVNSNNILIKKSKAAIKFDKEISKNVTSSMKFNNDITFEDVPNYCNASNNQNSTLIEEPQQSQISFRELRSKKLANKISIEKDLSIGNFVSEKEVVIMPIKASLRSFGVNRKKTLKKNETISEAADQIIFKKPTRSAVKKVVGDLSNNVNVDIETIESGYSSKEGSNIYLENSKSIFTRTTSNEKNSLKKYADEVTTKTNKSLNQHLVLKQHSAATDLNNKMNDDIQNEASSSKEPLNNLSKSEKKIKNTKKELKVDLKNEKNEKISRKRTMRVSPKKMARSKETNLEIEKIEVTRRPSRLAKTKGAVLLSKMYEDLVEVGNQLNNRKKHNIETTKDIQNKKNLEKQRLNDQLFDQLKKSAVYNITTVTEDEKNLLEKPVDAPTLAKKRGRKPKEFNQLKKSIMNIAENEKLTDMPTFPKKRGRKPKQIDQNSINMQTRSKLTKSINNETIADSRKKSEVKKKSVKGRISDEFPVEHQFAEAVDFDFENGNNSKKLPTPNKVKNIETNNNLAKMSDFQSRLSKNSADNSDSSSSVTSIDSNYIDNVLNQYDPQIDSILPGFIEKNPVAKNVRRKRKVIASGRVLRTRDNDREVKKLAALLKKNDPDLTRNLRRIADQISGMFTDISVPIVNKIDDFNLPNETFLKVMTNQDHLYPNGHFLRKHSFQELQNYKKLVQMDTCSFTLGLIISDSSKTLHLPTNKEFSSHYSIIDGEANVHINNLPVSYNKSGVFLVHPGNVIRIENKLATPLILQYVTMKCSCMQG